LHNALVLERLEKRTNLLFRSLAASWESSKIVGTYPALGVSNGMKFKAYEQKEHGGSDGGCAPQKMDVPIVDWHLGDPVAVVIRKIPVRFTRFTRPTMLRRLTQVQPFERRTFTCKKDVPQKPAGWMFRATQLHARALFVG
jgi:hypothetical protein